MSSLRRQWWVAGLQFAVFRPQNLHLLDFFHLGLVNIGQEASKPDERPNAIAAAYWRVLIRNLLEVEMLQHVGMQRGVSSSIVRGMRLTGAFTTLRPGVHPE